MQPRQFTRLEKVGHRLAAAFDTDSDALSDGKEVNGPTDPFDDDTDDDGLEDGEETNRVSGFGAGPTATTLLTVPNDEVQALHGADFDGDGDTDILGYHFDESLPPELFWIPNLGAGNFGAKQTISTDYMRSTAIRAADLDDR